MKQNIKRIWLALCMAVCLFALSACSSAEADTAEEMDPSLVMTLQQGTQQYLDLFAAMGDEDLDNALAASEKNKDTVMQSALNSWKSVRGRPGSAGFQRGGRGWHCGRRLCGQDPGGI